MTDLLRKGVPFEWTQQMDESLAAIKKILLKAPICKIPDTSKPMHLFTDASGVQIGYVCTQIHEKDGKAYHAIVRMGSRKLGETEQRWTVT